MNPKDQVNNVQQPLRQQAVERIKDAANVLVTVSANPSVDQLAAAIGFTLVLNKLGKHATAVFSGAVPSTIEFLQPEKTLEKTTDSLRDFIIALDKSKADKLRYKVEDKVVKIFITPYRTSISQKDLEFSQGDFNVDVVVALGVHKREDLDQAIVAHGRILHDAVVISVTTDQPSTLGTINLDENQSSSLSEVLVDITNSLQKDVLDAQMATAFLTGIVATTDRFRNKNTTPNTMAVSAKLMQAGANQQLVALELEERKPEPAPIAVPPPKDNTNNSDEEGGNPVPQAPQPPPKPDDGSLIIPHESSPAELNYDLHDDEPDEEPPLSQIHIDDQGRLLPMDGQAAQPSQPASPDADRGGIITQPPAFASPLSSNDTSENFDPALDSLSLPPVSEPILSHAPSAHHEHTVIQPLPPNPLNQSLAGTPAPNHDDQTLAELEKEVGSPHVAQQTGTPTVYPTNSATLEGDGLTGARAAVEQAVSADPLSQPLDPLASLNSQPVDLGLPGDNPFPAQGNSTFPPNLVPPESKPQDATSAPANPSAPPPVPPPMMPSN